MPVQMIQYTNLGFIEYDNVVHAPRTFQCALTLHSMAFVVFQSAKFLLLALICLVVHELS